MIRNYSALIISLCILMLFGPDSAAQDAPGFFSKRTKVSVGPAARFYWKNTELNGLYGLSLAPQFNIINSFADVSLSLDLDPMIGYHPATSSDSVKFFYGGAPATLNVNIGHLSTKDFRSDMGFFAGGGYSFDYIRDSLMYSPVATTGLRWWMGGRSFTVRYHIYFNGQDDFKPAHSIAFLYNFGPWVADARRKNKLSKFARPFRKDLN